MKWDLVKNNWNNVKGNVKEQWGLLSDQQLDAIAGNRDALAREIRATYDISKHAAEWQISGWEGRRNAMDSIQGVAKVTASNASANWKSLFSNMASSIGLKNKNPLAR